MKRSRNILLVILFLLLTTPLYAQRLTMGYLYPAGGQVGTTVEIEAGGLNINRATKVIFSHPGIKGELKPVDEVANKKRRRRRLNDQSSPQLADKIKIVITIDKSVPCGLYDLRLQGAKGVSNMLPFEVASYPNMLERKSAPRVKTSKINEVHSLPAVLCGYVRPGEVDAFRFEGKKGETIVAAVKARQFVPYIADAVPGWFQPVIKIEDSRGREVAYSDDYHHYVDPVIIVTLPKDDKYTLRIHDAIYRGREDFNYRIHLGVIPFVTGRYPAYGVAGKRVKQEIEGVNLGAKKITTKVKTEGYNQLTFTNNIGTSNAVPFYTLPKGSKLVQFPKEGARLTLATAISDSLTADAKIKRYKISAFRGEPIIVDLIGRRNGSLIDATMRLKNEAGKVVAKADDTEDPVQGLMTFHADPVLKYTPRRDEELILEVVDLHRRHGKDFHYLLKRHEQLPSFNAFVSPANITISSGGTASFRVDVTGRLKRPAHLVVNGLPKGSTTSNLNLRGRKWDVSITLPKGAEVKRSPIEVKIDYPTSGGREQTNVLPVDKMTQAFYYIHNIQASELTLDVAEPVPYRMSLDFDINQDVFFTTKDTEIPIKVKVEKEPGFNEPIELVLGNKNRLFFLEPISILPEESEKVIYIKLNETMLEKLKKRKNKPQWQMHIVGNVGRVIEQRGGRLYQNAKYREMTPIFVLKLKK